MPTVDDLINDLNSSAVFSKLDLSNAYHQLELDESSRFITSFVTHVGLHRYKRLSGNSVSQGPLDSTLTNTNIPDSSAEPENASVEPWRNPIRVTQLAKRFSDFVF